MFKTRNMSDGKSSWLHYPDIWKQSYMLEIKGKGWSEVFTFSLPPEAVEITFPQRVSETKTFGGMFIDDYGPDACKITFSGSTGNSAIKKVYRKGQGDLWLNGKEEIFYVRDSIIRYKENHPDDYGEARMYLYNLSMASDTDIAAGNLISPDSYEVVLKDFKISQGKDRPFFYSYSIEFIGLRVLGKSKAPGRAAPVITENTIKDAFEGLDNALAFLKKMYVWSENVLNAITKAQNNLNLFKAKFEYYKSLINGTASNLLSTVSSTIALGRDAYKTLWNTALQIIMPFDLLNTVVDGVKEIRDQCDGVYHDFDNGSIVPDDVLEKLAMDEAEFAANSETLIQGSENYINKIFASLKSCSSPEVNILPDGDGNDVAYVTYGSRSVAVTSETSLEAVADAYLGNANLVLLLAVYNGISGDDDLVPGMQLKIPIMSAQAMNKFNLIFAFPENRTVLGVDISLDSNGNIVIAAYGDTSTVSEYENMQQAIILRLTQALGSRVRLNLYGIKASVGDPTSAAAAYLAVSITDTVLQDPRITKVEGLAFLGDGDRLIVSFDYVCDDGTRHHFMGVI